MKSRSRVSSVALVALIFGGCGVINKWSKTKDRSGMEDDMQLSFNLSLDMHTSCADLKQATVERLQREQRIYQAYVAYSEHLNSNRGGVAGGETVIVHDAVQPATATNQASESTYTNIQESSVDEADHVKIGSHHILVARHQDIVVIDRASKNVIGYLPRETSSVVYGAMQGELYVDGDRLVQIEAQPPQSILVKVYELKKGQMPHLLLKKTLAGTRPQSRLAGGKLVLVIQDDLGAHHAVYAKAGITADTISIDAQAEGYRDVACHQIVRAQVNDADLRLVKIFSIDVHDSEAPTKAVGLLGGGDYLYMSPKDIFVVKQSYQTSSTLLAQLLTQEGHASPSLVNYEKLIITRVQFDPETGDLNPTASGQIAGHIIGQWAFKYFADADALSVATTTRPMWRQFGPGAPQEPSQNHLSVLQQREGKLEVVGEVKNFGTDETIQSVRYVNDTAYVVTFRQTDPLFAIDMSEPTAPKMLGELKIPGFSTYMHPAGPGLLIGFGYDATDQGRRTGMQLSLFDVADPLTMARLDAKAIGSQYDNSEAIRNHHAFMYDHATKLISIPISSWREQQHSDTLIFAVRDNKLQSLGQISHKDFGMRLCSARNQEIMRSYVVDEQLLTVSTRGLKISAVDTPLQISKAVKFSDENCK